MTIPADHIAIDGSTAWVIDDKDRWWHVNLDRPCDTCNGRGTFTERHSGMSGQYNCLDCDGTGRHTFTLDVESLCVQDGRHEMVDGACHFCGARFHKLTVHVVQVRSTDDENIHVWSASPLPQATGRGMWAVELKVHA